MEFRTVISSKGTDLQVLVKAISETLTVTVSDSSNTWQGSFNCKDIEELTLKTGNSKSFPTFCKLLTSALQGKHPALHVDFYSYQDLEHLRNGSTSLTVSTRPSKKKYLIVSYVTDFEKVHYPLTLILQEISSDRDFEVSKPVDIYAENSRLRQENISLVKQMNAIKEEFQIYKEKNERKVEDLKATNNDLESEIQRMKEELDVIIFQLEEEAKKKTANKSNSDAKNMKREREENAILRYELANCHKEIEFLRESDTTNKRLIEFLNKKLESSEEKEADSPVSCESPVPTVLKSSGNHPKADHDLKVFNERLEKVIGLIYKNKGK